MIDALAPSNNPLLNPAALKAAVDTGGGSFRAGLRHFVRDMAAAPRVPSMVEPDAFEVGVDLAVTPGSVVLRTPVFELIQYRPPTAAVRQIPLLIVPPTINKFYVVDLAPGRSLAEYLAASGLQVFMISWRNPDARHAAWDFSTYGQAILDAMDATGAHHRERADGAHGHLLGRRHQRDGGSAPGAHRAAAPDRRVHAHGHRPGPGPGGPGQRRHQRAHRGLAAAASRARGYLDGRSLAEVFAWLRPNDLIWNYWVNNYLLGRKPPPFDILFWNADTTRMTAGLHRDFLQLGVTNALTRPGSATMLGSPVDLSLIDRDTYLVAGVTDHICPWQSCYRSTQLMSGQYRFVLSTSGHIAAMVNPPGNEKASYQVADDSPGRPGAVAAARADRPRLLVAGLRRLARRAVRRGKGRPVRAGRRRPGRRSATHPEPTSMTADATRPEPPATIAAGRARAGLSEAGGAGPGRPSGCGSLRSAAGPSASRCGTARRAGRRCCCATASGRAWNCSSRSSTNSTTGGR